MTEESYTDDADVSHLEQRIDQLEETIRQMLPSRREAIGMGVAGLAGASLMSGTASAGSAQVGTIGDNSNLIDLVAEDVTITDTLNTASLSGAPAGEALLSDGNGNLQFGAAGGVEEVSTFDNLPAIDPPQLAYVTGEEQYYYSTPQTGTLYDLNSSAFTNTGQFTTSESFPTGVSISNDGEFVYSTGSDDLIYQYKMASPFDIGSAVEIASISTQNADPEDVAFDNSGSRMYEVGRTPTEIVQYDLTSNYNVSTATAGTTISLQDGEPEDICFNETGTIMLEIGSDSDRIYTYDLSTPFELSTASFNTFISSSDSRPHGVDLTDGDSKMYEVGGGSNEIYMYDLSTPGDITTATLNTSVSHVGGFIEGVEISPNGKFLFAADQADQAIYRYDFVAGGWERF